jgi:hypothetical protein
MAVISPEPAVTPTSPCHTVGGCAILTNKKALWLARTLRYGRLRKQALC